MLIHDKVVIRCVHTFVDHLVAHDHLDQAHVSVKQLLEQFDQFPSLACALEHPTIGIMHKQKLLEDLCKVGMSIFLWRFIVLIMKQGQANRLKNMLLYFLVAYQDYLGIRSATLTTSVVLPDHLIKLFEQQVKQLVSCKQVLLKQVLDPDIIGGYILEVGELKLDRTIKKQLFLLKKHLEPRVHVGTI